ncbi:MAG TPA: NAD(P)/FAD-dependent oxidoreductase [Caulobacterales bacterium]|nr:NAD(P)/FAD-dependent oxidoreductase [Caulobacterales bacterium]
MTNFDAIIVGGGAAGLFCALTAGARGKRVLVLERNAEVGAKILISGGGRCNFTNVNAGDAKCFISANPHFARSALARFKPTDFIALIEKHRIAYYEKTLGQLFCEGAGAAKKIVRMLLDECAAGGVEIRTDCALRSVSRGESFRVETTQGAFEAAALVVASGGLSIPKLGANDIAYRIAKHFNVPISPTRPGLVPLTFGEDDLAWMRPLSGVSTDVVARCGNARFREAALFTHRGLSGPATLQVSSYLTPGGVVELDWAPDVSEEFLAERKRARPKALIKTALSEIIPARLAEALTVQAAQTPLGDHSDEGLRVLMRIVKVARFIPTGTEGYAKAEVTVGGIDVNALSQQTMEARAAPGLFFIGECADVTGWLGGYNFQWAWASGAAAGRAI